MSIAYYNGKFSDLPSVRVSLSDRALFFGDGVYDAAIGRGGGIYMETEHVERFIGNAEKLDLALPYSREELSRLLHEAIRESGESSYFVYFHLTRRLPERRHAYPVGCESNFLITVTPLAMPNPEKRLSLVTYEDLRYYYCNVKTLNLLPSVLASAYAERRGADEAVFHRGKTVTECAHSNVSILKGGTLFTHPTGRLILPGTARARLIAECHTLGVPVKKVPFTLDELRCADEVIVTSSTRLAQMASTLDSHPVGGGDTALGERLCEGIYRDFLQNTV